MDVFFKQSVRGYALHGLIVYMLSCSVTSEVPAGVGWELPTPPLAFSKSPECGRARSAPSALPLDNSCTLEEELQAAKRRKVTAQKSYVVTDVQSSELFQCAFHRDTEMGTA